MSRLAESVDSAILQEPRHVSAFGELGLDYDRLNHATKEDQIRIFRAQLSLVVSKQWDLPLFLHCRSAFEDFVEIITPYIPKIPQRGVVHSFVGSATQMQKLLGLGLDISVNGFSFQDRESIEMVVELPMDRLHLETDAPWGEVRATSALAKRYCTNAPALPAGKKKDKWDAAYMVKERNESCAISTIAFIVAGLKGTTVDEVVSAAWQNSAKMFAFRSDTNV